MGVGKTTISQAISYLLPEYTLIDIDEAIETDQQCNISNIFAEQGEQSFRELEKKIFQTICEQEKQIISTGGGIVLDPENRKVGKTKGIVCWLTASPEVIYERIKKESHRPLLSGCKSMDDWIKKMDEIMSKRYELYLDMSDFIINIDHYSVIECAEQVKEEYVRLLQCIQ